MNLVHTLKGQAKKAALKALAEDRLWWRVGDQYGRSCNGGDPLSLPPSSPGKPGEWAPRIENVKICLNGYHVTRDPIRWNGCTCALVEIERVVEVGGDKAVCETLRELGVVDPLMCIDTRIYALIRSRWVVNDTRLVMANLRRANLWGANLRSANLGGADLGGADLGGADLRCANLWVADLRYANLWGANLRCANLGYADLRGADLRGADLGYADLRGADLRGADLWGADLVGANLGGQDKDDLKKRGAIL